MKKKSRSPVACLLIGCSLAFTTMVFQPPSKACEPTQLPMQLQEMATPEETVRAFYEFHMQNDKSLTSSNVRQRKSWLHPHLYKLLLKEARKPIKRDEVPKIDGDPFTHSQEYPQTFRIESTPSAQNPQDPLRKVTVIFSWIEADKTLEERKMFVQLKKMGHHWKIYNILNTEGENLLWLLENE